LGGNTFWRAAWADSRIEACFERAVRIDERDVGAIGSVEAGETAACKDFSVRPQRQMSDNVVKPGSWIETWVEVAWIGQG
jgi:hypothetical protein